MYTTWITRIGVVSCLVQSFVLALLRIRVRGVSRQVPSAFIGGRASEGQATLNLDRARVAER